MAEIAIRVEGLSKQYRIGGVKAGYRTIRETIVDAAQAPIRRLSSVVRGHSLAASNETIWALKDVSFEVKRGEVVGIIGRNGAGKTTLLKVLSRITEPTEGGADVYGRVGSLLEVGTGFHPELTGRENIYLNGAILGMRRAEIEKKFDEIVAFAEVERFIETPVKHYSSGMYVRLAFAVAAHLEPEILLVDEVLAVGDAAFQKKCLGKMGDVAGEGRTVLFVSHNMAAVQALCSRSILLLTGLLAFQGGSEEVIEEYLRSGAQKGEASLDSGVARTGNGRARFTRATLVNWSGQVISTVPMGGDVTIELEFECNESIASPTFTVILQTPLGVRVASWRTDETYGKLPSVLREGVVQLHVERLNLLPGLYYLILGFSDGYQTIDRIEDAIELEITPRPIYPTGRLPSSRRGTVFTPCSWDYDFR